MNILILIISLFFGIFTSPVFAAEKFVTIEAIPSNQNIIAGQTFPVNVRLETGIINRTFFYLFYSGLEGDNSYIQTRGEDGPILSFTDNPYDWENIPTFTTDWSGNGYLQSNYAYINPNTPNGNYSLYVKFFFPDYTSSDKFVSDPQQITVVSSSSITPNPTPIPTKTPISTSTSIPTPTPTNIPTPHNQLPELTPTPTINMKIFGITNIASTSAKLSPTPIDLLSLTEASSSAFIETGSNPPEVILPPPIKKTNFIPLVIFIVSFIGLLLSILSVVLKIEFKFPWLKK